MIFAQVMASERLHLAKLIFLACVLFGQVRLSKSATFFSKSFGKVGSGFFARLIFSGEVIFSQSQFLAKVLASSRLLRFGKSV